MKIIRNKVLVDFDKNIEEKDGFGIAQTEDVQHHFAVKGTVLQVPEKLEYAGDRINKYHKPYSSQEIKELRELNSITTSYDCPMELSVGDRVLFSYRAHFDLEEMDGGFLVDYELVVAKLDPIYPLNGWLLVEMYEKPTFEEVLEGVTLYNEDKNDYGRAIVKYAGQPLKGYIDFPGIEDDENIVAGCDIMFEKRKVARMELDLHNSLTEKQSSLFRIHRKDVLIYSIN